MTQGINFQAKLDQCRLQVTITTNAEKASTESVADFGNQHQSSTDEVNLSSTQVTSATEGEQTAQSSLSSLTSELNSLTGDVSGLSAQIKEAEGKGEDTSSLVSQLDAKNKELEAKKTEVENAKQDLETKKSEKQAAEIALQKAESKQTEAAKYLVQAQETNKTDKTNLEVAKQDLDVAQKEAEKAEKEQKEDEQLLQMCNGNETLAKKLQGSYDAEAGASLAQTARETHKNGVFDNACALGVRESLEAEGILEKNEIRGHASDLIQKYGESGKFDVIKLGKGEEQDLPEGSILAIKKKEGGNDGSIDQYGHIAIIGYKKDPETGEVLKDENGKPIREEISDHIGAMRDRSDRECYVIIPKSGNGSENGKVEGSATGSVTSAGTGHYINSGMKDAIEGSDLDEVTKGKLLGKAEGHQQLSEEDEEILKKANIAIDTSSGSNGAPKSGTGRYMDDRLKAGIQRSNLDEATKSRLLAIPEDSELSEADAKLINGTNLSSVGTSSGKMKAFSVANTYFEKQMETKLKSAKTEEARQKIRDENMNVKDQKLSEDHLEYLRSSSNPKDVEVNVAAYVDNFPDVFKSSVATQDGNYLAGYERLYKLQSLDRKDDGGNKDRTISIDELKQPTTSKSLKPEVRRYVDSEKRKLIRFLEENGKTSINIDKFRQMIIDAYEAGDNRHVNFMDCCY